MFPVHDISATGFPTILILNKFKWVKVPLYLPQNFSVVVIVFKDPTSIKKGINTGCGGLYSSQLGFQSCRRLWFHFPSDPGSAENSGWRRSMLGLGAQGHKAENISLELWKFPTEPSKGPYDMYAAPEGSCLNFYPPCMGPCLQSQIWPQNFPSSEKRPSST